MLYNKCAEVGLRRDGIVTKSDDERIEAERILNEPVQEVHHHSERVINPAIGEIVAMMGQIDEFKRIRARVKQAAISEKFKPEDVDKLDKEVQEFLEQPEVKDSIDGLEKANEKLDGCLTQLAEFEAAEDSQSTPKNIGDSVAHDSAVEYRANLPEKPLPDEYTTVEAQKKLHCP